MNTLMLTIPLYIAENIGAIIEDAVSRLNILKSTNNYIINETAPKKDPFFIETQSDNVLTNVSNDEVKQRETEHHRRILVVEFERLFLNESLLALKYELTENGQFTKFTHIINIEHANMVEEDNKTHIFGTFRHQSEKFSEYQQIFEKTRDQEISHLKDVETNLINQNQELYQKLKMEFNLLGNKLVQNSLNLQLSSEMETTRIQSEIERHIELVDLEKKSHTSMQRELRQICVNLLIRQDEFIGKYNSSKENIFQNIIKHQKELKVLVEKVENLKALIAKYKIVIKDHEETKKEIRIKAERIELLNKYARVIQKWWRCMVVIQEISLKPKKPPKKSKNKKLA